MRIESQAFWLPKDPRPPREYEDSAACSDESWKYAIADGASTAYQSGEWAVALTSAYIAEFPALTEPPPRFEERVPIVQKWMARQASAWTQQQSPSQTWYERDAAERGSAAAFLGLQLAPRNGVAMWESIAIGDCCLFHVGDGGQLMKSFPLASAEEFTDRPALLPTAIEPLGRALEAVRVAHGTAHPGDLFILASDAVSEWLLRLAAHYPAAWSRIGNLTSWAFEQLISGLRRSSQINNDDATLTVVRILKR